jgi:segregation and condensation protein B
MDKDYKSVIEAIVFASDEPINEKEIITVIREIDGDDVKFKLGEIQTLIDELNEEYKETNRGFRIVRIAGGFSFATNKEFAKYVGFLSTEKSKRRLSQAALETLALVAYKQPITKPEIEAIRGVNSDYMINTLLEKKLIKITGRAETIGRPLLYATTDEFLKYFGLNSLADLPKPREYEEIANDPDFIEQKRKLLMNQLEEEMEKETASIEEASENVENITAEKTENFAAYENNRPQKREETAETESETNYEFSGDEESVEEVFEKNVKDNENEIE